MQIVRTLKTKTCRLKHVSCPCLTPPAYVWEHASFFWPTVPDREKEKKTPSRWWSARYQDFRRNMLTRGRMIWSQLSLIWLKRIPHTRAWAMDLPKMLDLTTTNGEHIGWQSLEYIFESIWKTYGCGQKPDQLLVDKSCLLEHDG